MANESLQLLIYSAQGRAPREETLGEVRWNDPTATGSQGQVGDITVGNWTAPNPW